MPTPHRQSRFTLVELLISAAATVTLGAALFPATTAVRQDAKTNACAQNMKMHAIGLFNFASANDQALLNAPTSPGGDLAGSYGPRGQTAFRFATNDRPENGFAFGDAGIRTIGHPVSPPTYLTHTDRWMNADQGLSHFYWVAMSMYIVDGSGANAMDELFTSPADEQTRSDWDTFVAWVKNERNASLPALPEPKNGAAPIDGLEEAATRGVSNGSYLYPSSMFCTPEIWLRNPRTAAPAFKPLYEDWGRFQPDGTKVTDVENYLQVVRRNRLSDILHPSFKVAFFLDCAVHDDNAEWWFQPGARSTISLADGSARVIESATDAAKAVQRENLGPALTLSYKGPDNPGASPFTDDAEGGIEIPFIATWGGIRGRDLQ